MKEGWTYKKLGEVCDFRSGFAFKSSKFTKSGEPIIRISDIQNEEIDESNLVYFDPKSYKEDLSKFLIYPDDILIAMSGGTTGKLGLNTSNRKFYLNQRVGVFRENKKYLDHRFLFYFLHTKSEESLRIAAGAAQPNLSTAQINSFLIPLAPLPEQQKIVSRLDSAFAHIDELKANAEKQVNEARALFQKALSKAMEPKEGWAYKKLGEVCEVINGLWKGKKAPFINVGVIRNANFTKDFSLRYDNIEFLDVEERQYSKRKLLKGDLIVEKSGGSEKQPVGRAVLFDKDEGEFSFSNFTSVLRIKKDINLTSKFLYIYLLYIYKRGDTASMQKATTGIHNIELEKYLNIDIPYISLSEQQRIVSRLDSLSKNVKALEENQRKVIAECDALKQALLRKVFE